MLTRWSFAAALAALFFCLGWQPTSAQAEELPPLTLAIPTIEVKKGDAVEIPLLVGDISGRGYFATEGNVFVDPTVFKPLGIRLTATTLIPEGTLMAQNLELAPGQIRFAIAGIYAWEGSGPLFVIDLEAIGEPGQVSSVTVEDMLLNVEEVATITGEVRVTTTELSIASGSLIIKSVKEFSTVEIAVEENHSVPEVHDWTFQRNGDLLVGYTATPVTELLLPMDGRVTSVRLDEGNPVMVDLRVDQSRAVFLPITMGQ